MLFAGADAAAELLLGFLAGSPAIARDESVNLPSLGCEKFALGQLLVPEAHHIQGARVAVVGFATSLSALLTGNALT